MNIIKASFLNFCSHAAKMIAGLMSTKIIAIYTGPVGVAIIGQITNAMNLLIPFSNGGIGNGIVKYIAEYNSEDTTGKIEKLINTTLCITLLSSLVIAALICLFNRQLSFYLLGDVSYSWFFISLSFSIPIIALGHSLICIINGFKRIKQFVIIGTLNSIFSVGLAYFLTLPFGLKGALISLIAANITLFCLSACFFLLQNESTARNLRIQLNRRIISKLSKFAIMGLVSAAVVPISQIAIRTYIMQHFSGEKAGYWQGVCRVSDTYLTAILLPLSIYYLPRLSEIRTISMLKRELSITFLFSVTLATILSVIVYIFRDWIILLLFTSDFREMKILFPFQLLGNVVKAGSWTIGMLMWAKSMTRLFIATEIFFSLNLVLLTIYFLNTYDLIGVTYAYFLNQILYFLFLVLYFRKKIHDIL